MSTQLTPKETKILSLIAQGCSTQEVADRLIVSPSSVRSHLSRIYDKLQENNRVAALRTATRLGLIPFEPFFGRDEGNA